MLLPRGQGLRAEPKSHVFGFFPSHDHRVVACPIQQGHEKRGGEASGDRLDYRQGWPNSVEKQVADVQNLIRQGVDVLFDKSKGSCRALQARSSRPPKRKFQRSFWIAMWTPTNTRSLSGASIFAIGRAAGEYAVKVLGGAGNAKEKHRGDFGEAWPHNRGSRPPRRIAKLSAKSPESSQSLKPITPNGRKRRYL